VANDVYSDGVIPKNHTLLIVDDEVDLREILAFQFKKDGFNVLEASNGKEAFELVKSNKIDLVITDIQMPGGNGVELLDNIKQHNSEVPVVLFITGFTDISVEDAFHKGAEAVFAKPFDRKVLLITVLQALSPKEDHWQLRHWRGETALPVEITSSGFREARTAKVTNLSRGGLFISLDKDVPKVGEKISLKVQFTEGAILCIDGDGIVRWVRSNQGEFPPGCGVEFIGLSDQAKSQVIELINFLKTRQYISKN
jgi:CheY-like chemotaxis protein